MELESGSSSVVRGRLSDRQRASDAGWCPVGGARADESQCRTRDHRVDAHHFRRVDRHVVVADDADDVARS